MPLSLTSKERAGLKGKAHSLAPVVQIGKGGLTDAVVTEIDKALTAHELIKVRAGGAEREERDEWSAAIAGRTNSAAVASIGKVMVFWRPNPDKKKPKPAV